MSNTKFNAKRAVFFAVLLALTFVSPGSSEVYGQTAGFASSRPGESGAAVSGAKRIFNLNPFKSSDGPEHVDQANGVKPIATSQTTSTVSRSRQLAEASETKPIVRRQASASSARITTPKSTASRKSSASVAATLLDELEEDFEDEPVSRKASAKPAASTKRRSLREAETPDSLELLEDDSESDDEDESEESAKKSSRVKKSSKELSTDDEEDEETYGDDMGVDDGEEEDVEEDASEPAVVTLDDTAKSNDAAVDSLDSRLDESNATSQNVAAIQKQDDASSTIKTTTSGDSPVVAIETVGPKKLVVGQESVYKIVVRNQGRAPARKLVVTTELPESVVAQSLEAQAGSASIENIADRSNAKRCVWEVGTLDPSQARTLELKLTPTKRVAFELVSNFEFERASARADVEVQEPILEALIEGRDSIEWGVEDKFRIRIRNIGNGDADDVNLFVSTGENKATQNLGSLKAGEEKTIETSIKTVASDSFAIDVEAVGAYGVKASTSKRIGVLRGKLDVQVETPELQFVEGEFEAKIRVRNLGDATLQHVDVVAQIPEGVEAVFCSNQARRNLEKRRVYWSAPFLRPNEETVFTISCRVNAAGVSKFEVVGVDQTGVIAQSESVMNVESIAVLAMRVNAPKEPVAVGKRCSYELVVENNGTRDAVDVNSGVFLGPGLKPISIEGDKGVVYAEESKVLFQKIERLKAGESVVFRIQAEALAPGNQKVQAMLQSDAEDVSLMSEETTYCYSRAKKEIPSLRRPSSDVFETSPAVTAQKNSDTLLK